MKLIFTILLLGFTLIGSAQRWPYVFGVEGQVTDLISLEPLQNALVKLLRSDQTNFYKKTDRNGFFVFGKDEIQIGLRYTIEVTKAGYFNQKARGTTRDINESMVFVHNFVMRSSKPPAKTLLYDEHYDLNVSLPTIEHVDTVYRFLIRNPKVIIELRGHSDAEETEITSLRRAEEMRNKLVKRGIDISRIRAKGLGLEYPIFNEEQIVQMQDKEKMLAARRQNRRLTFLVDDDTYQDKNIKNR